MSKPIRLPKFWVLATMQLVLVIAAATIWFYFRTKTYLAGPPDPDTYAWSWDFQWVAFCIYWLPAILLFTGILLVLERAALMPTIVRHHSGRSSSIGMGPNNSFKPKPLRGSA